jgi:hypothetical protein
MIVKSDDALESDLVSFIDKEVVGHGVLLAVMRLLNIKPLIAVLRKTHMSMQVQTEAKAALIGHIQRALSQQPNDLVRVVRQISAALPDSMISDADLKALLASPSFNDAPPSCISRFETVQLIDSFSFVLALNTEANF